MKKSRWLQIRVTPDEHRILEGLSHALRMPMSEVVRRSVMRTSAEQLLRDDE